jgi:hypothetical protein
MADMQQHLRACLLKLVARLAEVDHDRKSGETRTFTFRIRTTRNGAQALSSDQRWCRTGGGGDASACPDSLIPIHTVNKNFFLRLSIQL